MTKYKDFIRAHGTKLACDFEVLPYKGLESVETRVMDDCIVAIAYFNNATPQYIAYAKYGEHGWFDTYGDVSYVERFNYNMEYVDWLHNMCSALTEEVYNSVFKTMKRMYLDDAKVRIGYKHMRAGIMDKFVFAKWLAKRYEKCVNI